jgi:hypothetical protein
LAIDRSLIEKSTRMSSSYLFLQHTPFVLRFSRHHFRSYLSLSISSLCSYLQWPHSLGRYTTESSSLTAPDTRAASVQGTDCLTFRTTPRSIRRLLSPQAIERAAGQKGPSRPRLGIRTLCRSSRGFEGVHRQDDGSSMLTPLLDPPPPLDFRHSVALATMASGIRRVDCAARFKCR